MRIMRKSLFAAAASALLSVGAQAQVVTPTCDASALVNAYLGGSSNFTVVSSSTVCSAASSQSGTFSGLSFAGNGTSAAPALNLGPGIVMSSGSAVQAASNTSDSFSTSTGTGSNAAVAAATGLSSVDQNVLSFSFTAAAGVTSISSSFIFGTEEFPEYAGSQFADSFLFIVDGVNYARFSDNTLVSLLSLASNANLYDNAASVYPTQLDGLTPVLTVTGLLDANVTTHTLQIVVSDTGDSILDSVAYLSTLAAGTGTTGGGGIVVGGGGGGGGGTPVPAIPEPSTYALMGMGLVAVMLARSRRGRRTADS